MIVTGLSVQEARSPGEIETFLGFPRQVYRNHSSWVPPVLSDSRKFLSGKTGFSRHCRHRLFMAKEGNRVVGTLAAFCDRHFQRHWNERAGFLGFFEALPGKPEPIRELFQTAQNYLREEGVETVYAPVNGQAAYPMGLLADRYDLPPCFLMAYNPAYYHDYIEQAGYKRAKKLLAYTTDLTQEKVKTKIAGVLEQARSGKTCIRPFNKKRFHAEARLLARIYAETFRHHFGYTPSPDEEFVELLEPFRPVLDPDLILFARSGESIAGFVLCVPDYNPLIRSLNGNIHWLGGVPFLLKAKTLRTARVIAIGVSAPWRGQNIAPFLTASVYHHMIQKGYTSAEYSWVLEENLPSRKVAESFYGSAYKHYWVYGKKLVG